MGIKKRLAKIANTVLEPFGAKIVRTVYGERPWDEYFAKWIAEARMVGKDPNDIGDLVWADDPLHEVLERYYFPHINSDSVVLELGPGTGRVTRHIISCCREMILVDYSEMVCDWLKEYLQGKGKYKVYRIEKPSLKMIPSESTDLILAHGVFEHIDIDDMFCFLEEFYRVLKPGGITSFNFDSIMSEEGIQWFKQWHTEPGTRCIFRFYHPDTVSHLAESVGYEILQLTTSTSRFAYIEMRKPMAEK